MESSSRIKYPQILVTGEEPIEPRCPVDIKPISPEPEVEECCEDVQLREIVGGLGIDYEMVSQLKYISHEPNTENCLHCKLLGKVNHLKEGINKIADEISATQEVLKIRKLQNQDLKVIIDRLEGSIGHNISNEVVLDKSTKSCSCNGSCLVI